MTTKEHGDYIPSIVSEADSDNFKADLLSDWDFEVPDSIVAQPQFFSGLKKVAPANIRVDKRNYPDQASDNFTEYRIYQSNKLRRVVSYGKDGLLYHDHGYRGDTEDGKWLDFYQNNNISNQKHNSSNNRQIHTVRNYRFGQLHGMSETFSPEGAALERKYYNKGILDGPYYRWYMASQFGGKIPKQVLLLYCNYDGGLLLGDYEAYYSNSQPKLFCHFRYPVNVEPVFIYQNKFLPTIVTVDDNPEFRKDSMLTFAVFRDSRQLLDCFSGQYVSWYRNGDLQKYAFYDHLGKLHGHYAEWLETNDSRSVSMSPTLTETPAAVIDGYYSHGVWVGKWMEFMRVLQRVTFTNYDNDGQVVSRENLDGSYWAIFVAAPYLELRKRRVI